MNVSGNFVYDSTGNLIEDKYLQGESSKNALVHFYCRTVVYCALRKSKRLKISYDWRGMPVEFVHDVSDANDAYKLVMAYDGSGRRISKTRMRKNDQHGYWYTDHVTHYTGIGTEVRESYRRAASPEVEVVVNVPNGLGRYGVEDASDPYKGIDQVRRAGYIPSAKIEWYLKNHLGSTMLVYGTAAYDDSYFSNFEGGVKAAYDYRAFGEQIDLVSPSSGKVTENFTGKEKDDETELNYFGARYLDPMLGVWTSVDPARQFASPYLYAGNGMNPINVVDPDGNSDIVTLGSNNAVLSTTHIDDAFNVVSVLSDGDVQYYDAPPAGSYFYLEYFRGEQFDFDMSQKATDLIAHASQDWPFDFIGWGTGGPYDFKNAYYYGADKTIGVLNGTVMTARDAGNAIWGGWTRHAYLSKGAYLALAGSPTMLLVGGFCSTTTGQLLLMQGISNIVATKGRVFVNGKTEDPPSATMQSWGFYNYKP